MENQVNDLGIFLPTICAVLGVIIGAKFGTRNENYILKLRPNKRFLNESVEALFQKIVDETTNTSSAMREYIETDENDTYKRFGLRLQLAEKILDIETSCETVLKKLGFDKETATIIRIKVNRKNEKLDYFDEPMGDLFDMEQKRLDKQAFMEDRDPNYKMEEK